MSAFTHSDEVALGRSKQGYNIITYDSYSSVLYVGTGMECAFKVISCLLNAAICRALCIKHDNLVFK